MKFPLAERLVPDLMLSESEREHYKKMAHALVEDTIVQYDEFNDVYHRQVNREQWKAVKRREHLAVYKERKVARPKVMREQEQQRVPSYAQTQGRSISAYTTTSERSLSTRTPFASTTKWTVPTLFMTGTIVGNLDDVMYGVATFDAPSMLLKTTYTHDELADGEILNEIQGPTGEDPFRHLGIRWIVKGNPAAVSKIVRPRDLVFLESTGISKRKNGERIGYHLMHSLDLPGYGPLQQRSAREILRGRVSSCTVFKQLANGTVDVYMKANFDPNGKVTEPVAVLSAANGLIYCWRSVFCAQHKKLAWLLRKQRSGGGSGSVRGSRSVSSSDSSTATFAATAIDPQNTTTESESKKNKTSSSCNTCGKSSRAYRQMMACPLCQEFMCSTCRVAKRISYIGNHAQKQILQRVVPFCKSCISRATALSALTVAKEEVLSGMWTTGTSTTRGDRALTNISASLFEGAQSPIEYLSQSKITTTSFSSNSGGASREGGVMLLERSESISDSFVDSEASEYSEHDGIEEEEEVDELYNLPPQKKRAASVAFHVAVPVPTVVETQEQAQLYQQIAQLRNAAESIYQITMNTTAMHISSGTTGSSTASTSLVAPMGSRSTRNSREVASFQG